ncbi:MAG: DUF4221 family protein [Bacteroidales bacterium]|nr:DUF4221 family protein [Bacteroidales bacterium]MDD3011413.1 DUF4221 family protein [Bacteroidales bacterium]
MKKLYYIVILLLFFGCTNENNDFYSHFIQEDSCELKYDILKDVSYHLYHYEADSILSFHKDHKLIAMDLKTGKVVFNLRLPEQKGFTYRDHLYHNQDSIFVCSIINDNMYILLMDQKGEVYNKWNLSSQAQIITDGYFFIDARYSHPMVLIKDKLYVLGSYHLKKGNPISQQVPIEIALDLQNGTVKQIGDIPIEYKKGEFFGNHQNEYSRIINEKSEMVFSFPSCHNLFVYDTNGFSLKTINCQSQYIERFEPINTDLSAIIDAYTYNAQYSDLVYDKYHKLYYRVVLHKLNKYDKNNNKNDFNKRNWSIIVLDEDFNITTELMMPVGQFWKRLFFTKQGLILKSIENNHANKFKIYKPCID